MRRPVRPDAYALPRLWRRVELLLLGKDQLTVGSLRRRRAPRTGRGAPRRGVPQVNLSVLRLGRLEAAIMTVMWRADGWLTTREIQDRIDYPTRAYTSVATVATILERKGYLRKRRCPATNRPGPPRWQYQAAMSLAEHLGHVIGDLLHYSPDPAATLRRAISGCQGVDGDNGSQS